MVRFRKGKLYQMQRRGEWMERGGLPDVWAYEWCEETQSYSKDIHIPFGSYVLYLKKLRHGSVQILWEQHLCEIHRTWLSDVSALGEENDNAARLE